MGVILPGVELDGILPQFFRGIGTGRDSFLWEWDGRGLRIHSRVTLYHSLMPAAYQGSRFKVQDFFICHIINYTEYNQK